MNQWIDSPPPPPTAERIAAIEERDRLSAEIDNTLRELGNTSDAIAARLTELGITGIECDTGECPIAIYLKTRMPEGYRLVSVRSWLTSIHIETERRVMISIVDLPAIIEFISRFDTGWYPNLARVPRAPREL